MSLDKCLFSEYVGFYRRGKLHSYPMGTNAENSLVEAVYHPPRGWHWKFMV